MKSKVLVIVFISLFGYLNADSTGTLSKKLSEIMETIFGLNSTM